MAAPCIAVAGQGDDVDVVVKGLAALLEVVTGSAPRQPPVVPDLPIGPLDAQAVCQAIGALLPEDAIVSDEGNTAGLFAPGATAGSPAHDWLCLTGGAIGQGLPVAVGAAVASPDRRVVALEADGSALYTLQAWWTMAREGLDVTTVLLNNNSYAVLNMELKRVGGGVPGPRARDMLDLDRPSIDFVQLARGLGLHAGSGGIRRRVRRGAGPCPVHPRPRRGGGNRPPPRVGVVAPLRRRSARVGPADRLHRQVGVLYTSVAAANRSTSSASSAVSLHWPAATLASTCWREVAPDMTEATTRFDASQATASSRRV